MGAWGSDPHPHAVVDAEPYRPSVRGRACPTPTSRLRGKLRCVSGASQRLSTDPRARCRASSVEAKAPRVAVVPTTTKNTPTAATNGTHSTPIATDRPSPGCRRTLRPREGADAPPPQAPLATDQYVTVTVYSGSATAIGSPTASTTPAMASLRPETISDHSFRVFASTTSTPASAAVVSAT